MTTPPLRWGVIGTATINGSLVPGLLGAQGCELAAIASRSADKARAEAERWGCRPYGSYEALLADGSIDAVYIPLPNHLHRDWVIRALEAGKHVLCEKPLALTVAEVDAIAEASARTGRLVMEAFMYRHSPRWLRALELVANGAVGDPRLANVVFAFAVPSDRPNIRFIPEAGGGIIWDMGCYAANMARGILGDEPTEVVALDEVRPGQPTETSVAGVMRFPEGRSAPFAVSFDYHNPFAQVEVVGTEGWLTMPGTGFRREPYTKLLVHRGGEIYVDGAEPQVELFAFDDPYTREVEHLAQAIRGEHPLAFGLDDARANTAVLVAMHASISQHAPISVAPPAG
jgi:D-xylose 1-dehydrogenase (NADP+, D-xylono-1,5-lactone-forming)